MSSSETIPEPTSDAPEVGFRLDGGNHDLVPKAVIDQLVRSKRIITYFQILSIVGILANSIFFNRGSFGEPAMMVIAVVIEITALIYLNLFTVAIRSTVHVPIWENAARAFRWLKAFWKFIAIVSVIVSCVGLFFILQWAITFF